MIRMFDMAKLSKGRFLLTIFQNHLSYLTNFFIILSQKQHGQKNRYMQNLLIDLERALEKDDADFKVSDGDKKLNHAFYSLKK